MSAYLPGPLAQAETATVTATSTSFLSIQVSPRLTISFGGVATGDTTGDAAATVGASLFIEMSRSQSGHRVRGIGGLLASGLVRLSHKEAYAVRFEGDPMQTHQ